jgi:hypothetical protein
MYMYYVYCMYTYMYVSIVQYSDTHCVYKNLYCRAPDGSCLLSCSNDNIMRLYNLPAPLYSDPGSTEDLPEMVHILYTDLYSVCWLLCRE